MRLRAIGGLVALDVAGVGLLFLLGLAAAGSTKGNPAQVALFLVVLPCVPLLIAFGLFVKTGSPGLRILALLIAARGETYYPTKYSFLRRAVSREQEPGMYWASIGVYAAIGIGTLTLGALGLRAWRRLGR